ncbi:MAG: hypothetical protein JWO48_1180 [Bryobacterales bacterium]|nr:hypothetical protein [Bryobacterales bacterium]
MRMRIIMSVFGLGMLASLEKKKTAKCSCLRP